MSDLDQPTSTLYELEPKRRPGGTRLGERLARTFGSFDRTRDELPDWESDGDLEFPDDNHASSQVALKRRVAELEYELERMQSEPDPDDAVAAEIHRIGEQTSSILLAANEQAAAIKREAQEQADRCLQDAATNAVKMTSEAKQRLSDLDTETDTVWRERARLLDDARIVANSLLALIEDAARRFPAEGEKVVVPPRPSAIAVAAPEPTADSDED
jgi:cell division septum initiation protein DivIVA